MLLGVNKIADAVKVTLGPKGRNVVLERPVGPPVITKDGVTVAKEIFLEDVNENMGAQLVKEVASKTADVAGDGTTTATLLAQAIFSRGVNALTEGRNPVALKRGIDAAVSAVVANLKAIAIPVERSRESIAQVGTISANGDVVIGGIIADAMEQVGVNGLVSLGESHDALTHMDVVDGMQFDRGYITPWFMNNAQKNICEFNDVAILITERKIGRIATLQKLLAECLNKQIRLLVIADDVEGEAIAFQVENVRQVGLQVCSVRAPAYGQARRHVLEDIAALTGGYCFTEDSGRTLDTVSIADLGASARITVSASATTIVGGKGNPGVIQARIDSLKEQIASSQDDAEKDGLKTRLAKMAGGVAMIRVGAPSETEMLEKKARVEDAIHATRAAVEEGVVPGGGTALIRCTKAVVAVVEGYSEPNQYDEFAGARIIWEILSEPLITICSNAGVDGGEKVLMVEGSIDNWGYNAESDKLEDLVAVGIIDPVKVTRLALQNAASVASTMLTTETMVSEIRVAQAPLHGHA